MKNNLILPIVVLTLGTLFALLIYDYVKEKDIELKYTITQSIPSKFIEDSAAEFIQILEVTNTGELLAKDISIQIDNSIKNYELLKHSNGDKVEFIESNKKFELKYPSLPSGGKFLLVLKHSSNFGIQQNQINITHEKGKATEATTQIGKSIVNFIYWGIATIYIFFVLLQLRSMKVDGLISRYSNYVEALEPKKPWYIKEEEWKKSRLKYIKNDFNYIEHDFNKIEETPAYKVLSNDKKDFISEGEWDLIVENSIKNLKAHIIYKIDRSSLFWNKKELKEFCEKPSYFPKKDWEELQEKFSQNFVNKTIYGFIEFEKLDELMKAIQSSKPEFILDNHWEKYQKELRSIYCVRIFENILSTSNKVEKLNKFNLLLIDNDQLIKKIEKLAYESELFQININSITKANDFIKTTEYPWLKEEDRESLLEKATILIEQNKQQDENKVVLQAIRKIICSEKIGDKPEEVQEEVWQKLLDIEKGLVSLKERLQYKEEKLRINEERLNQESSEVKEEKIKLIKQKEEVSNAQKKVVKQLKIIDELLKDPSSIYKIEEFDNPFAIGNFENLKMIADLELRLSKKNILK